MDNHHLKNEDKGNFHEKKRADVDFCMLCFMAPRCLQWVNPLKYDLSCATILNLSKWATHTKQR
jgi:hypothetical protein